MDTIMETLQQYKEHAESQGFNTYSIMLKGSQNYNLHDEESDIDANLVFIPTFSQLRSNKAVKLEFPTGDVTCHNIYSFAEIVAKGNPQWIEVCNTPHHIGESLEMFQDYRVSPSALKGMMMEKVTAFDKLYPSRKKYVEQFGYDPKQLHHIIRLYDLINEECNTKTYHGEDRTKMLKIKRGTLLTKDQAFEMRDEYVSKLSEIYDSRKLKYSPQKVNYEVIDKIMHTHMCKGK